MSLVDHPTGIRFNLAVVGLAVGGVYAITRWAAHCIKTEYEPWNTEKALNTIWVGIILGTMAAVVDPDATRLPEATIYLASIPLVDECLRWMRKHLREVKRECAVARREDGGVESVKQAYVEGDITLLEFENQVEEEIELEEI